MLTLAPSDGTAWTLDVEPSADGVVLIVGFAHADGWQSVRLDMSRPDSRILADEVLAAGGDGTMRTYPRPAQEAARG